MKKLIATVIVVLLLLSMVSCGAMALLGKGSKSKTKAEEGFNKEIQIENIEVEEIEIEKILPQAVLVVG